MSRKSKRRSSPAKRDTLNELRALIYDGPDPVLVQQREEQRLQAIMDAIETACRDAKR